MSYIVPSGLILASGIGALPALRCVTAPPAGSREEPVAVEAPPTVVTQAAPAMAPAPSPALAAPESPEDEDAIPTTLPEQRTALFRRMGRDLDLPEGGLARVEAIFAGSTLLGQGNPAITRHPMKRSRCRAIRAEAGLPEATDPDPVCGAREMVPLFDPGAGETPNDAKVCIDRYEFPGIPCEYPVVYASARDASLLCEAVGKRLCDAHEWEGACAGALHKPEDEYVWDHPRPYASWFHNKHREIRWSYGVKKNQALCATQSHKSPHCTASGWSQCGTNTFPAGAFPACVSPFGVYDLQGNAAEHMNLPLGPEELSGRGGSGATEMKGSWFIFSDAEVHEEDCRWRAKDWHPSKVMDPGSHRNYHLGFRCCKGVEATEPAPQP